jgi:hypothetical protein
VEAELKHQNVLDGFQEAFKEGLGKGNGTVGNRDFSKIAVHSLEEALRYAEKVGCRNYKARTYFILGQHLLRIRKELKEARPPNWTLIGEYLQALPSSEHFHVISKEVQQVEHELNDVFLRHDFVSALATGAASGQAGQLDTRTIRTDLLESTLHRYHISKRDAEVSAMSSLYSTLATFMLRVRTSVMEHEWDDVGDCVHAFEGMTSAVNLEAPKETIQEILLVRTELVFQNCLMKLAPPLKSGCVQGRVGELDVDAVNFHFLAGAIDDCGMHYRNGATDAILDVAHLVLRLRKAVVESDKEGLRAEHQNIEQALAALEESAPAGCQEPSHTTTGQEVDTLAVLGLIPNEAVVELQLVRQEIEDLRSIESLRRLLRAPGQIPSVASTLSMTLSAWEKSISPEPLSNGLSQMAAHPKPCALLSSTAQKLFRCALAICDIRKCARANHWFAVNTLYASDHFEGVCDTVLLEELTNITDNLSIRGMQFSLQNVLNSVHIRSVNHVAHVPQHEFKSFQVRFAATNAEAGLALRQLQGTPGGGRSSPMIQLIVKETEELLLHAGLLVDLRKRVMLADWTTAENVAHLLRNDVDRCTVKTTAVPAEQHVDPSRRITTEPLIGLCVSTLDDEIQQVLRTVQYKRDMDSCVEGLRLSCLEADMLKLRGFLDMADNLQLYANPDLGIASKLVNATRFYCMLAACTYLTTDGLRSNNIVKLKRGLEIAEALQQHSSESINGVSQARTRLKTLTVLRNDIQGALRSVDVVRLEQLLKQSADDDLAVDGLDEARYVVSKSEDFQSQLRLKRAIMQHDVGMATVETKLLKDQNLHKYKQQGSSFSMFWQFPHLREKGCPSLCDPSFEPQDLCLTLATLPRSLTRLPEDDEKTALLLNRKCIMGAVGVVHYTYPFLLARDLLETGKNSESPMRDEIYCQIVRLLIYCDPSMRAKLLPGFQPISTGTAERLERVSTCDRAWALLRVCLQSFPPSPCLETYLEAFLKEFADDDFVTRLHHVVVAHLMPLEYEDASRRHQSFACRAWSPPAMEELEAIFTTSNHANGI